MLLSNGAFAPTAFGDAQPQFSGRQYYIPPQGLSLTASFATYGAVYRAQPWIRTLVDKLAYGTARLPLKVYTRDAADAREEARDAPFAQLLRSPNPRQDRFFFWLWTVSTRETYGEALWVKTRPRKGAPPTQIWPMHPANIQTYRDDSGDMVYRYVFGAQGDKSLEWRSSEVVHFKSYNPENQSRGLSRLESLRQTVLNEDAMRRAAASMWSNGGRPSMAVTHPKTLSDPARNRLSAELNELHGGVDNWGRIAVLEEGMEPKFFPLNADELQYIEGRKISREEACGVYDVPPPVVHILDHATFSNITEQMRSMYRDTMAPRLAEYESVIDAQLRPDFDPKGSQYAEFLLDEVLRGDFETRAAANQAAVFSAQRTPNELRRQDNLPPMDGGDALYINAGAVPLQAAVQAPGTEQPKSLVPLETCGMCGQAGPVSERGLCRSCGGKVGRMLTGRKEISA